LERTVGVENMTEEKKKRQIVISLEGFDPEEKPTPQKLEKIKRKEDKQFEETLKYFFVLVVGVAVAWSSLRMPDPMFATVTFSVGLAMFFAGLGITLINLKFMEKLRKMREFMEKRHAHANEGLIWIWVTCLLFLVVYSIAFFVLIGPVMTIYDIAIANYTFPEPLNTFITKIPTIITWSAGIALIGMLIWALTASQSPKEVYYPAPG
jgi:uncharacterized membrane protein